MTVNMMLQTHPQDSVVNMSALEACVDACVDCANVCNACADACLGEAQVQDLIQCIRLNLDCADICKATGRVLSRITAPSLSVWRIQLEACMEVCAVCAQECETHAAHHHHCAICAEVCRRCEQACENLLESLA